MWISLQCLRIGPFFMINSSLIITVKMLQAKMLTGANIYQLVHRCCSIIHRPRPPFLQIQMQQICCFQIFLLYVEFNIILSSCRLLMRRFGAFNRIKRSRESEQCPSDAPNQRSNSEGTKPPPITLTWRFYHFNFGFVGARCVRVRVTDNSRWH